jgi:hypothetical protein
MTVALVAARPGDHRLSGLPPAQRGYLRRASAPWTACRRPCAMRGDAAGVQHPYRAVPPVPAR